MGSWGKTVIAAAVACVIGGSAQAQDAMWASGATQDNWSGFYFGGQIGIAGVKTHEKGTAIPAGETLLGDIPVHWGAFGGFHYQAADWWVWGLDAEVNYETADFFYNNKTFGKMPWDAAVRVTGGVPIAPNVLAYGSVGYSWAQFDHTAYYNVASPGSSGASYIGSGIQLGLGVDAMVTENIMARLMMTWAHYGVHNITNGAAVVATSEPSMIDVRAGVAFKF